MDSAGTSGVFARAYDSLPGAVEVGFAGGRVIAVSFPEGVPDDARDDHELLDRIGDYLAGAEEDFTDDPVGLTVPTDRRSVLEAVRQVPYGEEASVSQVTRMAGLDDNDADDLDLVTTALRENPVPLLVPDHRVQGGPYATPGPVRATFRQVEGL
ncbi:MGMT family protein [Halorubrum gandharaense]